MAPTPTQNGFKKKKRLDRDRPIKEKKTEKKTCEFFRKSAVCVCRVNLFYRHSLYGGFKWIFFFFFLWVCVWFSLHKGLHLLFRKKEKEKNITWHGQFRLSQRLNETSGISKRAVSNTLSAHIPVQVAMCGFRWRPISIWKKRRKKINRTVAFLYESVWCPMVGSVNSLFGCVCVCYYVVGSWRKGAEVGFLGPIGSYKRTWDE